VRRFLVGPIPRIIVLGMFAMSLQRILFAEHPLADVKLQFPLALVVAAGATGGSDRGAVAGFAVGLMYDLSGNTPVGLMALAYGIGGMVAGYFHLFTPDPQWWFAAAYAFVGAAAGELAIPLMEVFTGESGWITTRILVEVPVVALAAALLCPVLMRPARWMVAVKRKKWKAPLV
jgi:rod shape-determining protein MreD